MAARRLVYATMPGVLPSSTCARDSWVLGGLANGFLELLLLAVIVGVPVGLLVAGRGAREMTPRTLAIDVALVAALYLSALLLL